MKLNLKKEHINLQRDLKIIPKFRKWNFLSLENEIHLGDS